PRRLRYLLQEDRVHGAFKVGRTWVIPLVNGLPVISQGESGPPAKWKTPPAPKPNYIHVNSQLFGKKDRNGNYVPVITVKSRKSNFYSESVVIPGPCKVVYDFENPKYRAKCWIETYQEPTLLGEKLTFAQIEAILKEYA
ncbi:MAG: hypothetical protein VKL59_00820, partial [Nostocaceae cyanobacterium]|nr:hypothetical protein [Nostocaceae cyanobacterium]